MNSFKLKSRIITLLAAIFAYYSTYSIEQIQAILPESMKILAPLIVIIIGFGAAQLSEEIRVNRAEKLVHQKYTEAQTEEDIISTNDYENLPMEVEDDTT